jgi:hypothetical protein
LSVDNFFLFVISYEYVWWIDLLVVYLLLNNKDMIGLNDLVVGMDYIHNGETVFTYVGIGDNELSDHNIVLECGTESFLVGGDCITNIN